MSGGFEANTVIDECGSTNDLAKKLGESGAPHGAWISAKRQLQGRGRLGRTWTSEDGNLFLSIVVRGDFGKHRTWLPLIAAVGCARALPHAVKIKWPNDLTVKTPDGILSKIGGLLCEAHGHGASSFFVIGIGMNVLTAPDFVMIPTSRLRDLDSSIDLNDLRLAVVRGVVDATAELAAGELPALRMEYNQRAALGEGTEIEWTTGSVNHSGSVKGLGEYGELLVNSAGKVIPILADDVRSKLKVY